MHLFFDPVISFLEINPINTYACIGSDIYIVFHCGSHFIAERLKTTQGSSNRKKTEYIIVQLPNGILYSYKKGEQSLHTQDKLFSIKKKEVHNSIYRKLLGIRRAVI